MMSIGLVFLLLSIPLQVNVYSAPVALALPDVWKYLRKFGHVYKDDIGKGNVVSAEAQSEAVKSFQKFVGLEVTGKLDRATLAKLSQPRCGNPDRGGRGLNGKYAVVGSTWDKHNLTYNITKYTPDLTQQQIDTEIQQAFTWWSDVANLTFRQVAPEGEADISLMFVAGDHGDSEPFNGTGYVLAHALSPEFGGDVHFDEAEKWNVVTASGTENLEIVAAHEFGHSLGLNHSENKEALMWPYIDQTIKGLHRDDIKGIHVLYGKSNNYTFQANTTTTSTNKTLTLNSRGNRTIKKFNHWMACSSFMIICNLLRDRFT